MRVAEPGTFSLLKSFTPAIVSVMNCSLFGEALTQHQWYCVMIQIFGIIPVIISRNSSTQFGYDPIHLGLMFFVIAMGSINTVYNAKVIKELNLPIGVQNSILYSFGAATNFIFYVYSHFNHVTDADAETDSDAPNRQGFFYGYGNPGVILLLVLNSFVGIAITVIYKYGDAVLKTLSGPLCSAILVYISYVFFGMELDIVKASGAAVVVIDTLLYLKLPSAPKSVQEDTTEGTESNRSRLKASLLSFLLFIFFMAGLQIILVDDLVFFTPHNQPEAVTKNVTSATSDKMVLPTQPVAVCMVGAVRSLVDPVVHMSIRDNLLHAFGDNSSNIHLFLYVSKDDVQRAGTEKAEQPSDELWETVLQVLQPKQVLLRVGGEEDPLLQVVEKDMKDTWETCHGIHDQAKPYLKSFYVQAESIRVCHNMVEKYAVEHHVKYDKFVKTRPDVAFLDSVPVQSFASDALTYSSDHPFLSDHVHIMPYYMSNLYADMAELPRLYPSTTCKNLESSEWLPERMMKSWFQEHNMTLDGQPISWVLVRSVEGPECFRRQGEEERCKAYFENYGKGRVRYN
jgi:hypothetical protein